MNTLTKHLAAKYLSFFLFGAIGIASQAAAGDQMKTKDKMMMKGKTETAIFAAGCFWCSESDFEHLPGVTDVVSGYTGGHQKNPTYYQVSAGETGHAESVQVTYDPSKISYKELLQYYWVHSDPTVKDMQFCDHGDQYRTAIFYVNPEQEKLAKESKEKVEKLLKVKIYTEIAAASTFYPAEDYHQDYYKKNPIRYRYYRFNCGRDQRLEKIWEGKTTPSKKVLDL